MPVLAKFTAPAGHGWLDSDALADPQRLMNPIKRISADRGDHAHELVTEDEGFAGDGVTDAAGLVHVQVAAAEPNRLDIEHDLAGSGRWRFRFAGDADVFRSVKSRNLH